MCILIIKLLRSLFATNLRSLHAAAARCQSWPVVSTPPRGEAALCYWVFGVVETAEFGKISGKVQRILFIYATPAFDGADANPGG